MYRIEFLPIVKKDIDNIIYYISHNILEFPCGCSVYKPLSTLKNEYRSYKVKNFLIFYTINDRKNLITIVRVLYQKMNIDNILE